MLSDSRAFRTNQHLQDLDARPQEEGIEGGVWIDNNGNRYLPLYERKMIWIYDHRYTMPFSGEGMQHNSISVSLEQHQNTNFFTIPLYWISEESFQNKIPENYEKNWLIGEKEILKTRINNKYYRLYQYTKYLGNLMVQLVKIVTPSTTENRVKLHNKDEKLISIIIPLYNEENSILNVINRIPNNIRKEIIIVDDGSTDNSVKKIQELENDDVKIIQHEKNRGYGAALLTGLKEAMGDIIITMDSDGQHRPEEIPNIIAPILQNIADVTVGSRYLGACNFPVPFYKRLGEFCINICLWVLFRQTISNNQNGFRAYNKRAFIVFEDIKSVGMGFSTEIIFNAAYHNLHIMDVPMTGDPREFGSSYVNVLEILKSIIILISIFACKKLGPLLKRTRLLWLLKRILGILQKKGLI